MTIGSSESATETHHKPAGKPAPGWYTDGKHDIRRWWDGSDWTDVYEPPSVPLTQPTAEPDLDDKVALLGYGFAFLAPAIGLLIGLTLVIRGHSQSIRVIVLSTVSGLLWAWLVFGLV